MNRTSIPSRGNMAAASALATGRALIVAMSAFAMLLMATALTSAGPVQDGQNGSFCGWNAQCLSYYCADGKKCAPQNHTGRKGDYCHHDNHCSSGRCVCVKGAFGFCEKWEHWPEGVYSGGYYNRYAMIGWCL